MIIELWSYTGSLYDGWKYCGKPICIFDMLKFDKCKCQVRVLFNNFIDDFFLEDVRQFACWKQVMQERGRVMMVQRVTFRQKFVL